MLPFDRARPLWEFIVIEGLPGDRAAMLQKNHHTVTDGQGDLRLSENPGECELRKGLTARRSDLVECARPLQVVVRDVFSAEEHARRGA